MLLSFCLHTRDTTFENAVRKWIGQEYYTMCNEDEDSFSTRPKILAKMWPSWRAQNGKNCSYSLNTTFRFTCVAWGCSHRTGVVLLTWSCKKARTCLATATGLAVWKKANKTTIDIWCLHAFGIRFRTLGWHMTLLKKLGNSIATCLLLILSIWRTIGQHPTKASA